MEQQRMMSKFGSSLGPALISGIVGTLLAWSVGWLAPGLMTGLDWFHYDQWLIQGNRSPLTPSIVVITGSGQRQTGEGGNQVDRAWVAHLVDLIDRAGARVIGVDVSIQDPSPPSRGGAASDAMLLEAVARSENVVFPLRVSLVPEGEALGDEKTSGFPQMGRSFWAMETSSLPRQIKKVRMEGAVVPGLAEVALDFGQSLLVPDKDGVVRRVPLLTIGRNVVLPSFSLALFTRYLSVSPDGLAIHAGQELTLKGGSQSADFHIPLDSKGNGLIAFLPGALNGGANVLSFEEVEQWIAGGDMQRLRSRVTDKLVLLLFSKMEPSVPTPLSPTTFPEVVHASVLANLVQGDWVREVSPMTQGFLTLVLSCVIGWVFVVAPGWKGPFGALLVIALYLGLTVLVLVSGHYWMAFMTPPLALVCTSGLAALWVHVSSGGRIHELENRIHLVQDELAEVRDTLVARESSVESLEEDLEEARLAEHRNADREAELERIQEALQAQCVEAKTQEELTRSRLAELTRELEGLRAVTVEHERWGDSPQDRLMKECRDLGIITREPHVLALYKDIKKAARSTLSVLIQGEPGTGKELFARAVHRLSARSPRPFIAVNMAAISPELFESELFGHVKGSFTGALHDRKGFFELAHHGTIFLDEIGDLPFEQQGKLLRVLQEKTFYRVGATEPTSIDVRVVAATNKDLLREVSRGWFREDLYFRIKGLLVHLPPLRQRPQDIPLLAERFVQEATSQSGRANLKFSREAMAAIESHRWEGNIRELGQVVQQAVALAEGAVITREDLRLLPKPFHAPLPFNSEGSSLDLSGSDQAVLTFLRDHEFDMQHTAKALGWDRSTVTQRLKGMGFQALVETRGDHEKAALNLAGSPELAKRVELKLREYYQHLLKTLQAYDSAGPAIQACKKRFKNLPDRHFKYVELLIRQYFDRSLQHSKS